MQAWAALLSNDIWYTEAIDYYGRMKGREAVVAFFGDFVKSYDLKWDITRMKVKPDGTATVVLRHVALVLPKNGDKYSSEFASTPPLRPLADRR